MSENRRPQVVIFWLTL